MIETKKKKIIYLLGGRPQEAPQSLLKFVETRVFRIGSNSMLALLSLRKLQIAGQQIKTKHEVSES